MSVQNRYSKGKIYKLVNSVDDKIYVGSTCCVLSKRLYGHKKTAKEIPHYGHRHLNKIGWDKVRIILIENVNVETKDELIMREQHYIDTLKPKLNKQCEGAGICEHGQRKSRCVPCGGNGLCIHKKQKGSCTTCGGKQVCIHSKRKQACKLCNGDTYKCTTCNIVFGSKANLKSHKSTAQHRAKVDALSV